MGLNDEAEKLAVCHAVNVENEARIHDLEQQLTAAQIAAADWQERVEQVRGFTDAARKAGMVVPVDLTHLYRLIGPATEPHVEIGGVRMLQSQYRAAQHVLLEAQKHLERDLEDARIEINRRGEHAKGLHARCDTLETQVHALEAENARLETALLERLDHDHHGTAALEADLADRNARLALIDSLIAEHPRNGVLQEIRDVLDGFPPALAISPFTGSEAAAAVRMLAAIIRNLPATPPERLDALADVLTPASERVKP